MSQRRSRTLSALLLALATVLSSSAALALGLAVPVAPVAAPAAAQAAAPADPKPDAAIEPIPARSVPARADADEQFMLDVTQRVAEAAQVRKAMEARLEDVADGIADLAKRFPRDELRTLPVQRIESVERQWKFYERELADWRRDQEQLLESLSDDAAQLAQRRASWQVTHAAATTLAMPPALLQRIDGVASALRNAERALATPVGEQVELRRAATQLQTAVDNANREIDRAVRNYDRRLWRVDTAPYWRMWQEHSDELDSVAMASNNVVEDEVFFEDYLERNQAPIIAHLVFAVIALPLLLWLSVRSRKLISSDPELRSAEHALTRPISAWLVLVLVGTLVFEPGAPSMVHQAALLLALIPVLRLLPQAVYDRFGRWPYAVTALYVLLRLGNLVVASPFWYRTHLLAITALSLLALAWMLLQRSARARRAEPALERGRWEGLLQALGWLTVGALGISLAANLIGNVTLAAVLTRGAVNSAYIGLALYAGAAVLSAMVKLLLARRTALRFDFVAHRTGPLLQSLSRLIYVAAAVLWVIATLNLFRILRPVTAEVGALLSQPLRIGQVSITLANVLVFIAAIFVAFWLARTIRAILRDDVLPRTRVPSGVASSVSTLTYYAMVLVGLLVALAVAGFQVSQLAIVFGALGVGIGLGLQDVVKNFVSGLILMFERPIGPGDTVEVAGVSGTVQAIGLRSTTIKGFEGSEIIVPNGMLLSEKLINWTLSDQNRRIDVPVGVAYGSDPRKILAILEDTARNLPGVAEAPPPMVLFTGFGASSLDFSVRCWTTNFDDWVALRSELAVRIAEALKAEAVEVPFPQRDLHLRSVSPQAGAQLAGLSTPPARG
jgi:small-conductance mechanosensitive channel